MSRSGGIETDYHAPVEGDEQLEESEDLYPEFAEAGFHGANVVRVSSRDRNWREKGDLREFIERIVAGLVFIIVLLAILFIVFWRA